MFIFILFIIKITAFASMKKRYVAVLRVKCFLIACAMDYFFS